MLRFSKLLLTALSFASASAHAATAINYWLWDPAQLPMYQAAAAADHLRKKRRYAGKIIRRTDATGRGPPRHRLLLCCFAAFAALYRTSDSR